MAPSSDIGPAHHALLLLVGMSHAPTRPLESSLSQGTGHTHCFYPPRDFLGSAKHRTLHEVDLIEGSTGHGKDFAVTLDFVLNKGVGEGNGQFSTGSAMI